MLLCLSFPALAQKITVSGTVVDKSGEPLIGASVMAKGTSSGTATDFDGNYRIDTESNAVLVFSYVGYDTKEVPVNGQSTINVTLDENAVMLNEVVAIGYGTVKKSHRFGRRCEAKRNPGRSCHFSPGSSRGSKPRCGCYHKRWSA